MAGGIVLGSVAVSAHVLPYISVAILSYEKAVPSPITSGLAGMLIATYTLILTQTRIRHE